MKMTQKKKGMEKMSATPRENLLRTLRRQGFDRVPLDPNDFCPSQVEAFRRRFGNDDYPSFFGAPVRSFWIGVEPTCADWRPLYRRETLPDDIDFDPFGVGHSRHPGCHHMTQMHHPLRGEDLALEELRKYPFPRFNPEMKAAHRAFVQARHKQGLAAMAGMACTIWETAWYMRSMEDLMADMMVEDERAEVLLDKVTDLSCERARAAAGSGADILSLGDDIGMQSTIMMSQDLWRFWLKPRLARVIAAARNEKPDILIYYHSCGYVLPFIGELADIGVDILNPVQPECMSFEEVHRQYGDRISFWSTIGTQTTLPFGSPGEVKAAVRRNLEICGKAGGIVIGPTHMVEPEVPWENLLAMKEACEEFQA
jgi:uroporphyrinogen decarboxylase